MRQVLWLVLLIVPVVVLLIAGAEAGAEDAVITAFRVHITDGDATFRLTGHTLGFIEGERAEEVATLTDDELHRTVLLLASNPASAKRFANKLAEKDIALEIHFTRAGGPDEARYLSAKDTEKLDADLEAQTKANENNPKALEKLDEQSDFFAYVYGLAMKGKGRK